MYCTGIPVASRFPQVKMRHATEDIKGQRGAIADTRCIVQISCRPSQSELTYTVSQLPIFLRPSASADAMADYLTLLLVVYG